MKQTVEFFIGRPEADPRDTLVSTAVAGTPVFDDPLTVVIESAGITIILTGSFAEGPDGPYGNVNAYSVFQGTTKVVDGEGFDFSLSDLKAAATGGNPFKAITDVFLDSADKVIGSSSGDTLIGEAKNALLVGRDGADYLEGGAGTQTLKGGNGRDWLDGGRGKDVVKGGKGKDTFLFNDKDMKADTIKDFSHKDDTFLLIKNVFDDLKVGKLANKSFNIGKKAEDKNDQIIYDKKTGNLFYDSDGKGGVNQTKFATVSPDTKVKANDFDVGFLN